jgi:hypothetical protein
VSSLIFALSRFDADSDDLSKPIAYIGEYKLGEPEKASVFRAGLLLEAVSVALFHGEFSAGVCID